MRLIPDVNDPAALHPSEISSQEWAELLGLDLDEFAEWYSDSIDLYDDAYPIHDRSFAYGRIIAEWRAFARYLLDAVMTREPHPSHPFMHEQATRYLLKVEAMETIAKCEGFDMAAERYPDEIADAAKIADILADPDAIAARLAECIAAANDGPTDVNEGAA